VKEIMSLYLRYCPTIDAPIKGTKHVINRLSEKFQLGIISNSVPGLQYRKLDTLGIIHLFQCIVLSEEIGLRKPAPEIFWETAEILHRKPEECLYVGDSYDIDIKGAQKSGMKTCWFNPNGETLRGQDNKPDYEIKSLRDILELECLKQIV